VVLSGGKCLKEVQFNGMPASSAGAECVEVNLHCTIFNHDIYFIIALRQSDLLQFEAVIMEDCPSVPTVISPLKT
jgi:hypothetical protein